MWLKGLSLLKPIDIVEANYYIYANGKRDSTWHVGTLNLSAKDRARIRSRTFVGMAKAMARQRGSL